MPAYASTAKPYKGWGMEGAVARWYAALTKKSLEDFKGLARRTAEQIPPRSSVLEVAPGPGYFAIELARLGHYQVTAAFKNFSEPQRALEEMHRVLKPGGQALIIDLRGDASNESIQEAVEGMNLGAVNGIITKLTFRFMLLKRAYTKREFQELVSATRFHDVEIREQLTALEILLSKDRGAS
jgi:ubiquinone/menaquinone biosynthesis C-methylase UbiE